MNQKRSIFEDVGADAPKSRVESQVAKASAPGRRAVRLWLVALFLLVAAMIVVGGLTRLTDSGLSITEWKPVTGALPPMSADGWAEEFAKYQATPEFQLQNSKMSLAEFKSIYWWEWGHRQLGRAVGLVWLLGLVWFVVRKQVPQGWMPRLFAIGALGGLQGAIGWWMVSSGLSGTMLDVASYRLAVHLGLAFVILGLITWYIERLGHDQVSILQARRQREGRLFGLSGWLVAVAFAQILLGALVAGIDAGRGYIDWPLMAGDILPPESFDLVPWWRNLFENPALVQFDHRMAGYALLLFGLVIWWMARKSALARVRLRFGWVALVLCVQAVLGVATVLYAAPLPLAILHQIGAIALFVTILRARFEAGYPAQQSLRG